MAVNVSVRESMVVKTAAKTPHQSNLIMISSNAHTSGVHYMHILDIYIYKRKDGAGADNDSFFDPTVLKHALSNALVRALYPLAGCQKRNNEDKNARIEINCHADCALIVCCG
ncbi:hypothetical protein M0R45_017958 [Rubus argutus]|uniref:Uncharacterized protein n=1 Tax=Rubus argutus TaxID=59490 RepID=A0AAW1XX19_RUBAR